MLEEPFLTWTNYEREQAFYSPQARHRREWAESQHVEHLKSELKVSQARLDSFREESQAKAHRYAV